MGPVAGPGGGSPYQRVGGLFQPADPLSALLVHLGIGGPAPAPPTFSAGIPVGDLHGFGGGFGQIVRSLGGPVRAPEQGHPSTLPTPRPMSPFAHLLGTLQSDPRAHGSLMPPTRAVHPITALLHLLRNGGHPESASSMHVHQRNKDLLAHQARLQGL